MQSIVKTVENLIRENNSYISMDEIIKNLDQEGSEDDLKARIYTDLMTDGRFFFKDDKVNLTENFTLEEVNVIKASYSLEKLLVEENKLDEETINIQSLIEEEEDGVVDVKDFIEDELDLIGLDDD